MNRRVATAIDTGTIMARPAAPASDSTIIASWVAYAFDESGSDEKTGRAIDFGKSVWPSSPEDIGRPRTTRFRASAVLATAA